jgi:hypothetical protein
MPPWLLLLACALSSLHVNGEHTRTQTEAHDRFPPVFLRHELPALLSRAANINRPEGHVWSSSLDAQWFPTNMDDRNEHALFLFQLPSTLFQQQSLADRSAFWRHVIRSAPIAAPEGATDAVVLEYVPYHTVVVHCSVVVAAWAASSGLALWVGRVPLHTKLSDTVRTLLDKENVAQTTLFMTGEENGDVVFLSLHDGFHEGAF